MYVRVVYCKADPIPSLTRIPSKTEYSLSAVRNYISWDNKNFMHSIGGNVYNTMWSLGVEVRNRILESGEFRDLLWAALDEIASYVPTEQQVKDWGASTESYHGISEDEFEGHDPDADYCTCLRCERNAPWSRSEYRRLRSKEAYRVMRAPPEPVDNTPPPKIMMKLPLVVRGKYAFCVSIQDSVARGELLELYNHLVQMRSTLRAGSEMECHIVLFTHGTLKPVRRMRRHLHRIVPINSYVKRWGAHWEGGTANVGSRNRISVVDMPLAPQDIDDCKTTLDKFVYCLMTTDLEKRQRQWPLIDCIKDVVSCAVADSVAAE